MIHRGYSKYLRYLLLWNDILILNIINIVSGYSVNQNLDFFNNPSWLKYLIVYNLTWVLLAFLNPPFNIISSRKLQLLPILRSVLINIGIHVSVVLILVINFQLAVPGSIALTYSMFAITLTISRYVVLIGLKWYRKRGFNYRNIILVESQITEPLFEKFIESHPEFGYRLKKTFNKKNLKEFKSNHKGFKDFIEINEIDEVFINPTTFSSIELNELVNFLEDQFIKIRVLSDLGLQLNRKITSNHFDSFWFLDISPIPMDKNRNRATKRLFDIVFSILIISFVLSWLYPIIALIIYIENGSPILFKQIRTGEKNSEFNCLKFRTMTLNKNADKIQSFKGDTRITKIGKFLRKSSIDELPQFFNVLKGDMSVVGPRPHMLEHTKEYTNIVDRYLQRHHVKPGITGLAQTKGFRGQIVNSHDINGRVDLDKYYIENWTLFSDLKIISNTVFQIFKPLEKAQ